MSANIANLLYLVSGVLFILALRGLSHPTTSRQGNIYGMVGMGLAVATTLVYANPSLGGWLLVIAGIAIGGGIGADDRPARAHDGDAAARRRLPLARRHGGGFWSRRPRSMRRKPSISARRAAFPGSPCFEMGLGCAIGALTFTGSVIAFLKLDGRMSGKPIMLPARHAINLGLGIAMVLLLGIFIATESAFVFWLIVLVALALGILLIIPIGGADMPVVVSMLNSYSGWAAAGIGFTLGNLALIITGALVGLVGCDPLVYHVQGHEPLLHLGDPRRLRRRERGRRQRAASKRGPSRRDRRMMRPSS